MEEDKRVVDGALLDDSATESAPEGGEAAASDSPSKDGTDATAESAGDASMRESALEDEDISTRLRRAGDRINRASTEAEVFKRRRDKESAMVERDGEKSFESEKRKIEDDLKRREAAAEERRAAMEYAESYRARLRAERERNAAIKRKAEEKERARTEERTAREREIAEGIEREREEARARGARTESLLSKVDGTLSSVASVPTDSSVGKDEATTTPVSSYSPASEAVDAPETPVEAPAVASSPEVSDTVEPVPVSPVSDEASVVESDGVDTTVPVESTGDGAPTEKKDDYIIKIEDDASDKDILFIDGSTACEIKLASTAASASASVGATLSSVTSTAAATVAATATATSTATSAATAPATPSATEEVAPVSAKPIAAPAATAPVDSYPEVVRRTEDDHAAHSLDEYSSMISAVKRSDVPKAPVELATGTPIGDYEEDRELLHHADDVPKKQYVTKQRGEDFDITPKYPDPVGKPLTPKEAKRREREALAEERRALLEFERASKSKRRIADGKKSADERAMEEYESAEEARLTATTPEKKPVAPVTKPEKAAPVSSSTPAYPDPKTSTSSAPAATASPMAAPIFDKKALEKSRKRQTKNDLLLIEHRIYDEIRRLEMDTRTGEISFSARIEDGKEKRERSKKKLQLTDARQRLKLAKKYEAEDNARYYRLVTCDVDRARLPRRTDRDELRELRERLLGLLKSRDELNLKLIELYSLSEGGKGGKAQGRFNAEFEGRRRAFKRQLPSYRKYEKARISLSDKEILYPLMDERTELHGELAKIDYMLKKERAKGLAKKELRKDRRRIERKLGENKRAILHHEGKALRKAERVAEGNRAAILGWSVLGVIAVAAVLIAVFWKDIQPWLMNTALPWLGEKLSQLVQWVTSLVSGGANSTTPTDPPTA